MISLLRRNRKKTPKAQALLADQEQQRPPQHQQSRQQRPATRNHLSERFSQQRRQQSSMELYSDSSLDSLVFAASLGLVSTQQPNKPVLFVQKGREPAAPPKKQAYRNSQQGSQGLEFFCRFCGKGYRWKSTMRRHESLECGDKPPSFECPECDYKARQRGNLTVHIKRHHYKD